MPRPDAAARRLAPWLLLILSLALFGSALAAAPRIGVLTMQPGEVFFERFGHNALVVDPGDGGEPVSYNFGYFDPEEPDFLARFVAGTMRYRLVALPLAYDLSLYERAGRGVSVQWLDLDASEAAALAAMLEVNARPENAVYDYRYFTDNCSTRVRDALDVATGGLLKRRLTASSLGNTYRGEAVRLAWPDRWMGLGFHLGLSARADRPLSRWDEAFIPMRLADSLRGLSREDGRPLVAEERELLPHRLPAPPAELPRWRGGAMLGGLAAALGLLALGTRRPRLAAALALPFWALSGLAGLVMLFLWFGTGHEFAHRNETLFFASPLALLLLPGAWRAARGREPGKIFRAVLLLLLGSVVLGCVLKFMPFMRQENLEWLLVLVPLHWAFARHFRRLAENRTRAG
ncbi:MAG: membrane protein [Silanimonas sp.]|nr:MAG: membrane protein [Silanimonas sp.]